MSDPHAPDNPASDHGHGHDHPPHLAPHFETPAQKMEAGKLGMWVFLATEILMFGGLFCAYAVYRANNPDVFLFAHKALDTKWGAINTIVLLASSFTMAWGVRCAQLGQKKLLIGMLILTLFGGGGFMIIKTVEYNAKWEHSLWVGTSNAFYEIEGKLKDAEQANDSAKYIEKKAGHDVGGYGDGYGDAPAADDGHAAADSHGRDDTDAEQPPENAHGQADAAPPAATPLAETSSIALPAAAPAGLMPSLVDHPTPTVVGAEAFITGVGAKQTQHGGSHYPRFSELDQLDKGRTHIFFQIYFLMTGLHGFHVIVGIGLISWITFRSGGIMVRSLLLPGLVLALGIYGGFVYWLIEEGPLWIAVVSCLIALLGVAWALLNIGKIATSKDTPAIEGEFGPEYYTPIDLVGLYWHLVDLIWIIHCPRSDERQARATPRGTLRLRPQTVHNTDSRGALPFRLGSPACPRKPW